MYWLSPLSKVWLWSSHSSLLKESFGSPLHSMDQVLAMYWVTCTDFLLPTLLLSISGVPLSFGTGFLQVYSLFIRPERCQTFCCFDHCAAGWFSLPDDISHKDKNISCSDPFLQMLMLPLGPACLFLVLQYLQLIIFLSYLEFILLPMGGLF